MGCIKLGLELFSKKILINLAVALQLLAGAFLAGNLACDLQNIYYLSNLARPIIGEERFIYYMLGGTMGYIEQRDGMSAPEEVTRPELVFSRLKSLKSASTLTQITVPTPGGAVSLYGYDGGILQLWNAPLAKGSWFGGQSPGCINAVVSEETPEMSVGSVVGFDLKSETGKRRNVKFKIIGELAQPSYLLSATSGGNIYPAQLFKYSTIANTGGVTLIFERDALDGDILRSDETITYNNFFLRFDEDISEEDYAYNVSELSKYGSCATAETMGYMERRTVSWILSQELPTVIFVLIVTLAGIICVAIINTATHMRKFTIYYVCGARLSTCVKITLVYILAIIAASFALLAVLLNVLCHAHIELLYDVSRVNTQLIVSLPIYAFFLAASLIAPWAALSKNTIRANLLRF